MIDLKTLEQAFAKIGQIGRGEETFPVAGVPVTVRALSDEEQIQIWKYASVVLEGGEDAATQQEWMHRVKVGTLSHAIVQVGDSDLRDKLVATGEHLENGKPITREKVEVVRQLLSTWGSAVLLRIFARYGEFVHRVEDQAEKAVVYEPLDYEAEIARLEERITELRGRNKNQLKTKTNPLGDNLKKTMDVGGQEVRARQHEMDALERASDTQRVAEAPEDVFEDAPPEVQSPSVGYTEEQVRQSLRRQAQPAMRESSPVSVLDPDSSFIDPSDPDIVQQVQVEQARLLAQKQRAQEHQRQVATRQEILDQRRRAEVASTSVRSGRKPPHIHAAAAQEAVHMGVTTVSGEEVPVYKLPSQTLSSRGREQKDTSAPTVNPSSHGGVNPRFNPPRR